MISFFPRFLLILAMAWWPFGSADHSREIKKSSLPLPQDSQEFEFVRVLVMKGVPEIAIKTQAPFRVYDEEGRSLFSGDRISETLVRPTVSGFQMGHQEFRTRALILYSKKGPIHVGNKTFWDTIIFYRDSSKGLLVVNELPMEDYLKGVLPLEVSPKWPMEALKAQAIASRTFAFFRSIESRYDNFDVAADVTSQVYGGQSAEISQTSQAVDATRGEILLYQNQIFPAFFHANSGGATTAAENVWNLESHPSLRGGESPVDQGEKHYYWKTKLDKQEIERKLGGGGFRVKDIDDIQILGRDASGRAKYFSIRSGAGKFKIPSPEFRMLMGNFEFKSTLIDEIRPEGNSFLIRGRGFGHGVGMSQYGAKSLAELGYDYKKVLQYYYPGAKVVKYFRQ